MKRRGCEPSTCRLALSATLVGLLWPVSSLAGGSALPPGPSFDCAKASGIESVICGDPELAAADRRMADFYRVAMTGALGVGSNQLVTQRKWLQERDRACSGEAWKEFYRSPHACVAAEYDDRLEQLAIATLITRPNESLAELGRIRPKAEPLYRAAYDYASIDDSEKRIEIVEADLTPIYAKMDANTREHLQVSPYYNAATTHDAAASDVNFAAFFSVYATLGYQDNSNRITWPCAVLVKRPGLVVGLGSYFGGAIDGAIPNSDCPATLPPMGQVTALSGDASAAQQVCEGTIRFTTGREYIKLQDAVRLHRTEVWELSDADSDVPANSTELAWRRAHKVRSEKAEAALQNYYVRYFGTDAKVAKRDAWGAIDALIDGPFQFCE